MSWPTVPGGLRTLLATFSALIAGCASQRIEMNWPEEAAAVPLEPVAHESRQAIVERAYFFSAIYAFEVDGHGYELANAIDANRSDNIYELVFIDGELACSRDRVVRSVSDLDSDVTAWEWVSEPEGLEYLADRLRIGCGLAAWTPPKVWVAIPTPQPAIGADSVLEGRGGAGCGCDRRWCGVRGTGLYPRVWAADPAPFRNCSRHSAIRTLCSNSPRSVCR